MGHLQDITLRAIEVLRDVSFIAAEDTRRSRTLLSAHGLTGRLVSYHEHNERQRTPGLLEELLQGRSVALISDAGSPLISDPGYHIVQAAIQEGIPIQVIPGPSSVIAALQVAGFTADRFIFHGYAPRTSGRRERFLDEVAADPRTQVFFETPHRIRRTLDAMTSRFPRRDMVLCRELTKVYEETLRGTPEKILERIGERSLKGEMVLVVGPQSKEGRGRSAGS
ncbi:MAG: 16S rRNA (cytidine(1402)-2'-O)-methyltransferase [Candidatus Eisenbacteria bacterium]|uniref:Ribosomal RNA small subunit methyltransferase I n=1 Tax=Eiseniibacteriota bacterium TaxID=2212470 RepID=A0A948RR35_UNCEI|nr:16S rRNA (cytidine(1402)-2'-O)-methyltransferase [Candidatus Eisenbacteria bacterium]MBU1947727.1 16S rRNA (cytidine(1402)-2'-O)-methyltransferase [Candidatus Eisenbacteria bacterium]MBU2689463.1 16S rRNA (cytidine(1402)-2'-O)-methyltransferase [Candidatus Eisenbacteria bacterium]